MLGDWFYLVWFPRPLRRKECPCSRWRSRVYLQVGWSSIFAKQVVRMSSFLPSEFPTYNNGIIFKYMYVHVHYRAVMDSEGCILFCFWWTRFTWLSLFIHNLSVGVGSSCNNKQRRLSGNGTSHRSLLILTLPYLLRRQRLSWRKDWIIGLKSRWSSRPWTGTNLRICSPC